MMTLAIPLHTNNLWLHNRRLGKTGTCTINKTKTEKRVTKVGVGQYKMSDYMSH